MKKPVLIKFLMILALTVISLCTFEDEYTYAKAKTYSGKATVNDLLIRSKPTTNSKVIGSLKKNQKITAYVKNSKGWTTIKYGKKKAYVYSEYTTFSKWSGKYRHGGSGTGSGSELEIKNVTTKKFTFVITQYVREGIYAKESGKATIKNNKAYYSLGNCKIKFVNIGKEKYTKKQTIYTGTSAACKTGGFDDLDLKVSDRMGYQKD